MIFRLQFPPLILSPRPVGNASVVLVVLGRWKGRFVHEISISISGRGWQSDLKVCRGDSMGRGNQGAKSLKMIQ